MGTKFTKFTISKIAIAAGLTLTLSACEEGAKFEGLNFLKKKEAAAPASAESQKGSIKLVERDVEAPEVFEVNETALWDGRPSLGGVWVAHPDSKQPEQVIIRNEATDKFVIGALFRRERDNPGPELQLSSDAASALGVQAGSPTKLRVTALRRETINAAEVVPPVDAGPAGTVETTQLDAAPNATTDTQTLQNTVLASLPSDTNASGSKLDKPFVQIGFFSVQANAKNNVEKMKANGIPAKMVRSEAKGKTFWRVLAGPAGNASERRQLLSMVKSQGFNDAYFVTD